MKTMLHLGTDINADSLKEIGKFIQTVFESAAKNRMDREVIIKALERIDCSVSSCNISNNSFVNKNPDEEP